MRRRICGSITATLLVLTGLTSPVQAKKPYHADGLVESIVKAPVVPDGTTAGRPTDFVINFDTSMDPSVPGRLLEAGKTIKVTLPAGFQETAGLPFHSVGEVPTCVPGDLQCNTAVMLQGWPQHPIRPPFQKYSIGYNALTNTIIYTALEDLIPNPPLEPGIKQLHLLLLGFTNPRPGHYRIKVEAEIGPGGAVETGWAKVHIIPKSRPSINITSVFNPGTPNTIYQETTVGTSVPFPYDFLLWARQDEAFEGVDLEDFGFGDSYLLRQGQKVVGHVFIDAPDGASGQMLSSFGPSFPINAPVTGVPTARWTAEFTAGSEPGLYSVIFSLNGGKAVHLFVYATQ